MLEDHKSNYVNHFLKIISLLSLVVWQLILFYLTYYLYHLFGYSNYLNLESWVDHAIPYISWSFVIYYFGFIYIALWGIAGIWNMSRRRLKLTIAGYATIITMGALIRLVFPSDAPWQFIPDLHQAQYLFKNKFNIEPLGGFPSMHAAISTMTAFINFHTFQKYRYKYISILLALLVCCSIVTAKEHWAIDVPAGIVIGLTVGLIWLKRYNSER